MMPEKQRGMGASGMTEEPKPQVKDTQESEENNRWSKILWDKSKGFFLDNPTLALTLAYLFVTAIGMLYSAVLYGRFGINIFDYSEIADFVLAAFKNPIALLVAVLQVPVAAIFAYVLKALLMIGSDSDPPVRSPDWVPEREETANEEWKQLYLAEKEQSRRRSAERFTKYNLPLTALITPFFTLTLTYYAATETASSIKNDDKPTVEVSYRSFSSSAGQVTVPGLVFIGATQRAAFFYDEADKRTIVIPQAQIVSMEVPEQKAGTSSFFRFRELP